MKSERLAIVVEDVTVTRGSRTILHDLQFGIGSGTVTGLLGPSGSGKTTLLRAVMGVQRNVDGQISVLDQPAGAPALRRRVAYVTQEPSVYADLTVTENMSYFAAVLGTGEEEIAQVLDTVGLAAQVGQRVATLSSGQRPGSLSPPPSSAAQSSSCSTNPPSDWIRCCVPIYGTPSTASPRMA